MAKEKEKPADDKSADDKGAAKKASQGSAPKASEKKAEKESPEKDSADKVSAEKASAERASGKSGGKGAGAKGAGKAAAAAGGAEDKSADDKAASAEKAAPKKPKKRAGAEGIAHVRATFNNTLINITDMQGNVIAWGSPGKSGFKGSRKSTPFAAQIAAEVVGKLAYDAGVRKVEVHLKGAGNGRESSIRALASAGIKISAIKDYTSIPHNGCRPPKRRRV
jgi:small subunit ribosomal protein S11